MIDIHSYSNDSGIYGIYVDGVLVYIGKAKNFHQRFNCHMTQLRHSEAQWYPLAREFNKRGHNIEAKIIEKVPITALREIELKYIERLNPIFNIDGCIKGKTRPENYDATIGLLGITAKPPIIEKTKEPPQKNWFGEEIKIPRW